MHKVLKEIEMLSKCFHSVAEVRETFPYGAQEEVDVYL